MKATFYKNKNALSEDAMKHGKGSYSSSSSAIDSKITKINSVKRSGKKGATDTVTNTALILFFSELKDFINHLQKKINKQKTL